MGATAMTAIHCASHLRVLALDQTKGIERGVAIPLALPQPPDLPLQHIYCHHSINKKLNLNSQWLNQ